jgi:hypothetical protein
MVFSKCKPTRMFTCKGAAARKQALKQKLAGMGAYHGVSLRLMLVDKQVDAEGALPHAALDSVHVIQYDSATTTLSELQNLVREAHRQNGAPFLSIAVAHHGADDAKQWAWTSDLVINLGKLHSAMDDLAPVIEVLAAALAKTRAGKAHIDLLACGLATACKGLVPALEKMYGIDFRASTDDTGNAINGGDWKMETDNDYDVAADYLCGDRLKAYSEKMGKTGGPPEVEMVDLQRTREPSFTATIDWSGTTWMEDYFSQDMGTLVEAQAREWAIMRKYEVYAFRNTRQICGATISARVGASATGAASLQCTKEAITVSASVGLEVAAEASAKIDKKNRAGKFEAAMMARMAAYAEAYVKANVTQTSASVSAGAKIGAGVRLAGQATWTSPGDVIKIEVGASAEVGAVLQATTAVGFGNETAGIYEFEFKVAAGGGVAL